MKRAVCVLAVAAWACTPALPSTLRPPARTGVLVRASRSRSWEALLRVWQANTDGLGEITAADFATGLLQASLDLDGSLFTSKQLREWCRCEDGGPFHPNPDRLNWSVVVTGDSTGSRVIAAMHPVKAAWDCRSSGEREAQLERAVKQAAEEDAIDPQGGGREAPLAVDGLLPRGTYFNAR